MEYLKILLIIVGGTAGNLTLVCGLLLWFIHNEAKLNRRATTVETGGWKFLVKGGTLYQALDNLGDSFTDTKTYFTKPNDQSADGIKRKSKWLEKKYGIFWVSLFWPMFKVFSFTVVADKLKALSAEELNRLSVSQRIVVNTKDVSYLRRRFPHPLVIPSVELSGDNWQIDFLIMLDIEIVNPKIVVFDYKGTSLRLVDAEIAQAVIDYCSGESTTTKKDLTYFDFVKETKDKLTEKIVDLNDEQGPDGLINKFGIKIVTAKLEAIELSPNQKEEVEASKANTLAEKQGEALVTEAIKRAEVQITLAKAQNEAIFQHGQGNARATAIYIESLVQQGFSRTEAVEILNQKIKAEALRDSKITTYVEGGRGDDQNNKPNILLS